MSRWKQLRETIGLSLLGVVVLLAPAQAQIQGDGTLNTQVNGNLTAPCAGNCDITNGTTRSGNLFHSFRQFSLPNGDFANFITTPAIQNVIVRVTGIGQPFISNINGTIATSNPVNFFLLNPNGIVFGAGAALNIGGSFLATTADRMVFQDGTAFRTTDPAPLLTITAPIGLGFTGVPQNIELRSSFLSAGDTDSFTNFILVGRTVLLDDTLIKTPGQRVELAGVGASGVVGLNLGGNTLSLNFPENLTRADLTLTNQSLIDVAAGGGGDIAIYARNINLSRSDLNTGIALGLGTTGSQAGNIALNATGAITLTDRARLITSTFGRGNAGNVLLRSGDGVSLNNSAIFTRVNTGAIGNGGTVDVQAGAVFATNNSRLDASTRGRGNAGNTVIRSQNAVSIDRSNVGTGVEGGTGNGGSIDIQAANLSVTNGARFIASTLGRGNAGNIVIQAQDSVLISGIGTDGPTTIRTAVDGALGNGGNIQITTGTLQIANSAQIASGNTFGLGSAGNIMIQARDRVSLQNEAVAFSGVQSGIGNGGNIDIQTGALSVTQGSQLLSGIDRGFGLAGNVTIRAKDIVSFSGIGQDGTASAALATLEAGSVGRAGNVDIQTGSLFLESGAQLASGTAGFGNAGNVVIQAQDTVSLNGADTTIFSNIAPGGVGRGGNVDIQTRSLFLSNGASITASTSGIGDAGKIKIATGTLQLTNGASIRAFAFGLGDAGDITIQASDAVSLDGANSGIATITAFFGKKGGDITLSAGSLALNNGAQLLAATIGAGNSGNITIQTRNGVSLGEASGIFSGALNFGQFFTLFGVLLPEVNNTQLNPITLGDSGDISISAASLRLDQGSVVSAFTTSGNGGNVQLNLRDLLLLRRGSTISTTAGLASAGGNGGNLTINTPRGFIVAVSKENSDITANAFTGSGGNIQISAEGIFGTQFRPQLTPLSDITASSTFGINGLVSINTPDVDPSRGLTQLPTNLVDPSNKIDQRCIPKSGQPANSFTVTGRGGLASSPTEPLMEQGALTELVKLPEGEMEPHASKSSRAAEPATAERSSVSSVTQATTREIIEAKGWIVDAKGNVQLVADASTVSPATPAMPAIACTQR